MENDERIAYLEKQIKNLEDKHAQLKKHDQMKKETDDTAANMACMRDSLMANGFTDDQAMILIVEIIRSTKIG